MNRRLKFLEQLDDPRSPPDEDPGVPEEVTSRQKLARLVERRLFVERLDVRRAVRHRCSLFNIAVPRRRVCRLNSEQDTRPGVTFDQAYRPLHGCAKFRFGADQMIRGGDQELCVWIRLQDLPGSQTDAGSRVSSARLQQDVLARQVR